MSLNLIMSYLLNIFFIIYFRMHVTRLTPLMCHAFISMQLVNYSRLRMLFDFAFDNCGIDNASMKRILIKDVMMYQTLLNPKFRVYEFKSNYVMFIKQFLHYLFSYALDETNTPYVSCVFQHAISQLFSLEDVI